MILKRHAVLLLLPLLFPFLIGCAGQQPVNRLTSLPEDNFNFIIANDLGRNGYYLQKPIAETMGNLAETVDIEFVAAAGDVHHFEGVRSVNDPLWMTNYELIYAHPELMIDWFAIMGNHEYRGNTQAVIDYSGVSRRWNAPARYYARSFEVEDTASLLVVFVDTTPMIDKYRRDSLDYPDAGKQNLEIQLEWIDSTLAASDDTWKVVIGHHPVYAQTDKKEQERIDMQERLNTILTKYGIDMYICGHIHNFQHIRDGKSDIDYVVNSSASLARDVEPVEGTQFCSPEEGFSVMSLSAKEMNLYMLDSEGSILYTVSRRK